MAQCALKPLLSGFFLSLILLASTQMAQAERCRAIKIEGDQKIDDVQIDFSLISGDQSMSSTDSQAFSVTDGSDIDLCFQSNKTGLLSLWSYSADGSAPSRLLPHELTTVGAYEPGLKVEAGKRYCLSELLVPNRKIAIKVRPPFGRAQAHLHFAKEAEQQFGPEDFPVISDKSYSVDASCESRSLSRAEPLDAYHSVELVYEVKK